MIKIKDILFEITGREAYDRYVLLKDEEISIMKQLLSDKGLFIQIQQKTGKIKQSSDKDFFEFPKDLNDTGLKSDFENKVGRVKDIRTQVRKLDDIIRREYGEEYLNKKLKPHYANQYKPIISNYTDATLKTLKGSQEKGIETQKADMASARDKYREDLRKWYAGGKKGPEPKMPITQTQQQSVDQYQKDFQAAAKKFNNQV